MKTKGTACVLPGGKTTLKIQLANFKQGIQISQSSVLISISLFCGSFFLLFETLSAI